jgi:hypothetical protein
MVVHGRFPRRGQPELVIADFLRDLTVYTPERKDIPLNAVQPMMHDAQGRNLAFTCVKISQLRSIAGQILSSKDICMTWSCLLSLNISHAVSDATRLSLRTRLKPCAPRWKVLPLLYVTPFLSPPLKRFNRPKHASALSSGADAEAQRDCKLCKGINQL